MTGLILQSLENEEVPDDEERERERGRMKSDIPRQNMLPKEDPHWSCGRATLGFHGDLLPVKEQEQ